MRFKKFSIYQWKCKHDLGLRIYQCKHERSLRDFKMYKYKYESNLESKVYDKGLKITSVTKDLGFINVSVNMI